MVFVIGIALLLYAIFYPVPREEEVINEITISDAQQESNNATSVIETLPTDLWRTSKGQLTIAVPNGWDVSQRDAGSASEITVVNPDAPDESLTVKLVLSYVFGEFTDFDSWMNEELIDADRLNVCENTIVDSKQSSCVIEEVGGESTKNYFGSANTSLYFRIGKPVDGSMDAYFNQIIGSLNFEPTKAELADAQVIQ